MNDAVQCHLEILSLETLANHSACAISDLLTDDDYDHFTELSTVDQVRYRYNHADCDDLALLIHLASGWDVISVCSDDGPLHRLISDPNGRLLDASGWVTSADLEVRYQTTCLSFSEPGYGGSACQSMLTYPEDFVEVVSAAAHFDCEPFLSEIRPMLTTYAKSIGFHHF